MIPSSLLTRRKIDMKNIEFNRRLAAKTELPIAKAGKIMDAIKLIIEEELTANNEFALQGLINIKSSVSKGRSERKFIHPATKKEILVEAKPFSVRVKVKISKEMTDSIKARVFNDALAARKAEQVTN